MWAIALAALKTLLGFAQSRSRDARDAAIEQGRRNVESQAIRASVIRSAMASRVFWLVWGLFAIPLGLWWALVLVDSMIPARILALGIPDLPQSIRPWAEQIFDNVFLSGAGVGGAQIAGRAAVSIFSRR